MITDQIIRDEVRRRADFACEYCGVTEVDTAGLLTIDHFQPSSKEGNDDLENLVYCCNRCNSYKHDYFPTSPNQLHLWNPRNNNRSQHFFELENGQLKGLTPKGQITIDLLRLNRPALIKYRQYKKARADELQLLQHHQQLVSLLRQTNQELAVLVNNQQGLLEQQQQLLKLLLEEDRV